MIKTKVTTCMSVLALILGSSQPIGSFHETDDYQMKMIQHRPDGFVPHEKVTIRPVEEQGVTDVLIPDFGSSAYL